MQGRFGVLTINEQHTNTNRHIFEINMRFAMDSLQPSRWPSHVQAEVKKTAINLILANAKFSAAGFESTSKSRKLNTIDMVHGGTVFAALYSASPNGFVINLLDSECRGITFKKPV